MRFLERLTPARLAATLLLMLWVGPVTIEQSGGWRVLKMMGGPPPAEAESKFIPAGQAIQLERGTQLELRLKGGRVVQGRLLGRTLLDSTAYAPRFEEYARTSAWVPFAMGESLRVSLYDGRELTGPFAGYAEQSLLLRSPDGSDAVRVPFEHTQKIERMNGARIPANDLARAFRGHKLPSAEALALGDPWVANPWVSALRVPVEDIETAVLQVNSDANVGGAIVGGIVLGVLVGVVLFYVLLAQSFRSSSSGCSSTSSSLPGDLGSGFSRLRLTERPFDRDRACFTGDPLAAADPWPGTAAGLPTALAAP